MPKPNRNNCKNNGERTNLLPIQGARSAVYKNLKWVIPEKNPKKGLRTQLEFSAITTCQVLARYQPLATNKPLLALFSLFTNAITQLAASAIPIATMKHYYWVPSDANDDYTKSINQAKERTKRPLGELTNIASYLA